MYMTLKLQQKLYILLGTGSDVLVCANNSAGKENILAGQPQTKVGSKLAKLKGETEQNYRR